MTLAQLKKLCEGLFKVAAQEQAVFLKAPDNPFPEALGSDDDDRQLDFFGLEVKIMPCCGGGLGGWGRGVRIPNALPQPMLGMVLSIPQSRTEAGRKGGGGGGSTLRANAAASSCCFCTLDQEWLQGP